MTESMVKVARVRDVPRGEGRVVEVGGRPIALFATREVVELTAGDVAWFAIDNTCPHRGGPLGQGTLAGTVVTCPWHGWRWDITTGRSTSAPGLAVACYRVALQREDVCVSASPR